jgi:hypothetical protein
MREAGLSAGASVARRSRWPGIASAPGLVRRDFARTAPDRLRVADLSQIATCEQALISPSWWNCFSRRCVDWPMADHMRAEFVVEALGDGALATPPRGRPEAPQRQGGQYVSLNFARPRASAGIEILMCQVLSARQRRLQELLRRAQQGTHPPALLANPTGARERRLRVDRRMVTTAARFTPRSAASPR